MNSKNNRNSCGRRRVLGARNVSNAKLWLRSLPPPPVNDVESRRVHQESVLAEPFFADLPVAVGQDVVSVDGHGISVVEEAVDEIEATSQKDHAIPKFWVQNTIDNALMRNSPLNQSRPKRRRQTVGGVPLVVIQVVVDELVRFALVRIVIFFSLVRRGHLICLRLLLLDRRGHRTQRFR